MGQKDLPVKTVRDIVGPYMKIGVSVENMDQVSDAVCGGANYLSVGPIFNSMIVPEKASVNIKLLTDICDRVDIPVVTWGGINLHLIPGLLKTGISGIVLRRQLFDTNMIMENTDKFYRHLSLNYKNDIFFKE